MIGIKNQQFGVESEFTGITHREAATALADYFLSAAVYLHRKAPLGADGLCRVAVGGL